MNHLDFVAVIAIFKIVKVMAIAVMPIELVIYISRQAKRKGCPKTAREKGSNFNTWKKGKKGFGNYWNVPALPCLA